MAVYLPQLAASLVKAAAKDEGRYAMAGVRVLDPGNGTYRLEATDGRRAIILRGYNLDANLVPGMPEVQEDAEPDGVVPSADWIEGFRMVPREKGYNAKHYPLRIDLGKTGYAMGTFGAMRQGRLLEGRWPPLHEVLPKRPAKVSVCVNPKLMIDLMQAALAIVGDEPKVTIHFWAGDGHPVGISCMSGEHGGVYFDGLIMPLS